MLKKQNILKSLETFINKTAYKLTEEEVEILLEIQNNIKDAGEQEEILKWAFELLKFIALVSEFIDK